MNLNKIDDLITSLFATTFFLSLSTFGAMLLGNQAYQVYLQGDYSRFSFLFSATLLFTIFSRLFLCAFFEWLQEIRRLTVSKSTGWVVKLCIVSMLIILTLPFWLASNTQQLVITGAIYTLILSMQGTLKLLGLYLDFKKIPFDKKVGFCALCALLPFCVSLSFYEFKRAQAFGGPIVGVYFCFAVALTLTLIVSTMTVKVLLMMHQDLAKAPQFQ